jgi:hypothetical protein
MTRKFNDLVTRGTLQSSSTSLLLGIATPALPDGEQPADTHGPDGDSNTSQRTTPAAADNSAETSGAGGDADTLTQQPDSVTTPTDTTTAEQHTPSDTDPVTVEPDSANPDSAARQQPAHTTPGLEPVLALLPAGDERLLTGPRRDIEVRDLTYDVPSGLYFSFTRLKTELARHAKRKVTNPDLMDVALGLLGDNTATVLEQLEQYSHIVFDTTSTRRRLTVRVAETRYRHLVDTALDIEERVGKRIPVTDLWALSIAVLLANAGRLPQPA